MPEYMRVRGNSGGPCRAFRARSWGKLVAVLTLFSLVAVWAAARHHGSRVSRERVSSCEWPRAEGGKISGRRKKTAFTTVVVTLCNDDFVDTVADLVRLVRCTGAYDGPIVVLYSGTRALTEPVFAALNVTLQEVGALFPVDLRRPPPPPCSKVGDEYRKKRVDRWSSYYAKTAVFSVFFKRWDRVLWMDARNGVYRPIAPLFDAIDSTGALLANPDAWPAVVDEWNLSSQFFPDCDKALFTQLCSRFDMGREYFQSTLMLFDTALVNETTLSEIAGLFSKYSRIGGSDQPFFSLYWDQMRGVYRQLPYRLPQSLEVPYDFFRRIQNARYIVLAWREGT